MLMTFLDNAIKFSPIGGRVSITLDDKEGKMVSIRDKGIGIHKEDLPYVFDRFYKTKEVDNIGGTGLGLAIAKQIALRHDAEISVSSVPGQGSEFYIKFKGE